MSTWGSVYNWHLGRGHDHGYAAFAADQWEKRQRPERWKDCPSTHCERRQECASPHECSAKSKRTLESPATMKLSITMQEALKAIAHGGGYAISEGNGYWKSFHGDRLKVPEREDSVVTAVGTRTIYSLEDRGLLRRAYAPGKLYHRDTRILTLEGEKICNQLIAK